MSPVEQNLVWVALPYACLVLLVAGMVWRWRTDQFGWTSRSSQWNESRILRLASPVFHLGFLMIIGGHLVGLMVPSSWTEAVGVSQHVYHLGATYLGTLAAVLTILGLVGLIYRRVVVRSVRLATTRNDVVMYCFLTVPVLLGTFATVTNQLLDAHGYNYRETISPWLRSVLVFQPQPALMAEVPLSFKLHVVAGLLLLAIWPFTRLVHAVSAPVGYTTRPYVVYRSREATATPSQRRGWALVRTQGTGNQGANDIAPSQGA
ncbi:respiratory nitrate reductase subunit gamma [Actinomyces sp. 2119]|uniref:Respiratory nitrate reductase subunit gamma n=1 Tax=Actinomyces lilanjuaniae TaxID=2321394 RepID=A0ABN5PRA7_9ACTO|nr:MULTISPECIES: respiratory nitrate reductase subunit gamma [Actinomyces]AYD89377.1 respiratory nitrate reductase subunit gamma [Actinomyces lilanjuaniae]RJF43272.1 respiratory nitrate reductase subunit gamma [Actinomyces sp. 2119]